MTSPTGKQKANNPGMVWLNSLIAVPLRTYAKSGVMLPMTGSEK
jgi:hypothetical protein